MVRTSRFSSSRTFSVRKRLSFAKSVSDSRGDSPCSCDMRVRRTRGSRKPQAVARATRDGGCQGETKWRRKGESRGVLRAGSGRLVGRCGTMRPAGRSDDAGHRLRESAQPCPSPAARWAWCPAHPSPVRGEFERHDNRRSSASGYGGGGFRSGRGRGPDTRVAPFILRPPARAKSHSAILVRFRRVST